MNNNNSSGRARLAAALSARGVNGASGVVAALADDEIEKAAETTAYFDEQRGVGPGLLVKFLKAKDWQVPSAQRSTAGRFEREAAEMVEAGFTIAQAPFAVAARWSLKLSRGEVTIAGVRARLKALHPELFEEQAA